MKQKDHLLKNQYLGLRVFVVKLIAFKPNSRPSIAKLNEIVTRFLKQSFEITSELANTIYYISPFSNGLRLYNILTHKERKLTLPFYALDGYETVQCNDLIMIIGGRYANEIYTADVNEIKISFDFHVTCNYKESMHIKRAWSRAYFDGNSIYVAGGFRKGYLADCEEYSMATNSWMVLPHLNEAKFGLDICGNDACLYAFGGFNGDYLSTIEVYDKHNEQGWEILPYTLSNPGEILHITGEP